MLGQTWILLCWSFYDYHFFHNSLSIGLYVICFFLWVSCTAIFRDWWWDLILSEGPTVVRPATLSQSKSFYVPHTILGWLRVTISFRLTKQFFLYTKYCCHPERFSIFSSFGLIYSIISPIPLLYRVIFVFWLSYNIDIKLLKLSYIVYRYQLAVGFCAYLFVCGCVPLYVKCLDVWLDCMRILLHIYLNYFK